MRYSSLNASALDRSRSKKMASTPIAGKPQQKRQKLSASGKAENVFLEQQQLEHKMRVQKLAMEMEFLKKSITQRC